MIRPRSVESSLAKLTLLPGEFSIKTSGRSGSRSPTLMKLHRDVWKYRDSYLLAAVLLLANKRSAISLVHSRVPEVGGSEKHCKLK